MTRSTVNVTFSRASSEEIPEHLNRGVLLLLRLSELGVLDAVEQRLKIPRQSGYNGVHLFIVAVLALMSGSRAGLQTFRDQMGAHETKIAALLGFKSLPAASSIARLLGDLPATLVETLAAFALTTPEGHRMLFAGSLIGGVIAFLTYGLVVISAPMLLDRQTSVFVATITSFRAVAANLGPMIVWALLIAALTLSTVLTGFLALVIVFPWLGLATWRAYGELVES